MTMALSFVLPCSKEVACEQEFAESGGLFEIITFCKEAVAERLAGGAMAVLVLPTAEAYCWTRLIRDSEELDVSVERWLVGFHDACDLKRTFARQVECIWLEEYVEILRDHGDKTTFMEALLEQRARTANFEDGVALIDQIAWRLISDKLKSFSRYQESCAAKVLYFKDYGSNPLESSIAKHLRGLAQIAEERAQYDAIKVAAAEAETRLGLAAEKEIRLNEEIANCLEELSKTRDALALLKRDLVAECDRSRGATKKLEQLQKRADEADAKLQRVREERDGLIEAVEDIYASNSWKLTAPMRAILKGVRRHDTK